MPRLDRHLGTTLEINRRDVRLLLAQGRVKVDGIVARDIGQIISRFSKICFDGKTIQSQVAHYLMINKPPGVVSATVDHVHPTVLDLVTQPFKDQLHIVGRLDFNATGLILLTNDGQWSRRLSMPDSRLLKRYRVRVEKVLTEKQVEAFARGLYFKFEGITTRPAQLKILSDFEAEVGLIEGRYHQIKRMFGQFDNKVLSIHRIAVGPLTLDRGLALGEGRALTGGEIIALC